MNAVAATDRFTSFVEKIKLVRMITVKPIKKRLPSQPYISVSLTLCVRLNIPVMLLLMFVRL
jgi:hypothetical protein